MKLKHFLSKAKHAVTDIKSAMNTVLQEAVLACIKANLDDFKVRYADNDMVKIWLDAVTEETTEIPAEVYTVVFEDLAKPEASKTDHMKKCHEGEETTEEKPSLMDVEVVVPEQVSNIIVEQVEVEDTKVLEVPVAGGEVKEVKIEAPAGDGVVAEVAIIPADSEAPIQNEVEEPKTEEEAPVNEEGAPVVEVSIENVTEEVAQTEEIVEDVLPVEEEAPVEEDAPVVEEDIVVEEPKTEETLEDLFAEDEEEIDLSGVFDETGHMDEDDIEPETVIDSIVPELVPEDTGEGNITEEAIMAVTEEDSIVEEMTAEEQEEFNQLVELLTTDDEGQNPVEESPKGGIATAKAKKATKHIKMEKAQSDMDLLKSLFGF